MRLGYSNKNESYSPGDPESSPGNLASKLLTTICASCHKVNATRDLSLPAAVFQNNFQNFFKSRGTADCCYMNFHHGGTLGAPSGEELLFKFLLVMLCPVVPRKA